MRKAGPSQRKRAPGSKAPTSDTAPLSKTEPGSSSHKLTPTSAFVGRERELSQLTTALEAMLGGQSAFHLVVGEGGAGKTRLADEFATYASSKGVRVAWGRAWEAGGAPP